MNFRAIIPFIPDMGTISPIVIQDRPSESKEKLLLWHLNSMRDHDGLKPWKRLPRGITYEPIEDVPET